MTKGNVLAFVLALALHVLLGIVLFFKWEDNTLVSSPSMQASIVDLDTLYSDMPLPDTNQIDERLEDKPEKKIIEEIKTVDVKLPVEKKDPPKKVIEEPPEKKVPTISDIKPAEKSEAAKKALALRQKKEKEREETQRKIEKEKQLQIQKQKEAQARRKKEDAERAKANAELKEKQAAQSKKDEAAKAAKKRRDEATKKANAQREIDEAALAESLGAEQSAQDTKKINLYIKIIQSKVKRNWTRPTGSSSGLSTTLRIRLSDDGRVLSVTKVSSSGNLPFDQSAINAVKKAARFEEITELPPTLFRDNLQDFKLRFQPE